MLSWKPIELGLERLLELVRGHARVQEEFERSRKEFFVDVSSSRTPLAELRHLEWFLLERPSPELGGIPVQVWQAELGSLPVARELGASLLQSIPGAFEVTSILEGEGLWLRDLFTLGEHPLSEIEATQAMEAGDLLVGRLFPAGAGTFLPSPAVAVFRNPVLVAAVRRDLEAMRAARRGVLRIQQLELERLFHGRSSWPLAGEETADVFARARDALQEHGLGPEIVEEIVARILDTPMPARGRVITETLDTLAFETQVDLESTRLLLVELAGEAERVDQETETNAAAASVVEALEAFDRGRAEGKDLQQLFRELERDLGVEGEEEHDSEEDPGGPELQGVIGAVIEEFLWEMERERGPEQARSWGVLRVLGEYASDIGVFEELGPARLLDFSARWVLDESGLGDSKAVESLLESLEAFCRWCEERQELPLWSQFGATLAGLRDSLPRHVQLRRVTTASGRGAYRVQRVGEDAILVSDEKGNEKPVAITREQASHLRAGDLVRVFRGEGGTRLGESYPPELTGLRPS